MVDSNVIVLYIVINLLFLIIETYHHTIIIEVWKKLINHDKPFSVFYFLFVQAIFFVVVLFHDSFFGALAVLSVGLGFRWIIHDYGLNWLRRKPTEYLGLEGNHDAKTDKILYWLKRNVGISPLAARLTPAIISIILTIWILN